MPGEVHAGDVVGNNAGAEVERLLADKFHHLGPGDGAFALVGVLALIVMGDVAVSIVGQRGAGEGLERVVVGKRPGRVVLDLGVRFSCPRGRLLKDPS